VDGRAPEGAHGAGAIDVPVRARVGPHAPAALVAVAEGWRRGIGDDGVVVQQIEVFHQQADDRVVVLGQEDVPFDAVLRGDVRSAPGRREKLRARAPPVRVSLPLTFHVAALTCASRGADRGQTMARCTACVVAPSLLMSVRSAWSRDLYSAARPANSSRRGRSPMANFLEEEEAVARGTNEAVHDLPAAAEDVVLGRVNT
jgi:hypothetical protein